MKFKRVEIQAFKSYLDKRNGTFDFTVQKDQPADIVSIFAPNGFGKTSFYDAIDYCMTSNITRFIRDVSLANVNNADAIGLNQEGEKQHILRANNAPENLESKIKIITDAGDFERKIKPARAGSKDYAFNDKKTKPEERYFRSVMLSQEAIDGFLREFKPEARYARFMEEQLGGDDTLEKNRQSIQSMLAGLKNRLESLEEKVEEINNKNLLMDLEGDSIFDSSSLRTINELIEDLNQYGFDFDIIDERFDDEEKARLLLKVSHAEESYNNDIESLLVEKERLESFLDNLPVNQKNHNDIVMVNDKVSSLTKQINDIEQFKLLDNEKSVLKEQVEAQRATLDIIRSREAELPDFLNKIHFKFDNFEKLDQVRKDQIKNEQARNNNQAVIEELEKQKVSILNEIEEFKSLEIEAPEFFAKIAKIEENIKQKNSAVLTQEIVQLDSQISAVKSDGVLLKGLAVEELEIILDSKFNDRIHASIAQEYADVLTNRDKLNKELAEIRGLIDSSKQQENSISTLIELGSQLVNKNQDQHCPLCQHKHDSFDLLVKAINSNSSLNDNQKRLLKEFDACQTRLRKEDDNLKKISRDFSEKKNSSLDSLREQLHSFLKEKQSRSKDLDQLELDIVELNRLKVLTAQQTQDSFKSYIDDEVAKALKAVSAVEDKIDKIKDECNLLINFGQQLKVTFASISSQSNNGSDFVTDYLQFLSDLNVPHDVIKPEVREQALKDFISSRLNTAVALFKEVEDKIKNNEAALNVLYSIYPINFFEEVNEKKLAFSEELSKFNDQLVLLNRSLREFYDVVKQIGKDQELQDDNWELLVDTVEYEVSIFTRNLDQKRELVSDLKSLRTMAEQVLKYIEFVKSTNELHCLDVEIRKCVVIKNDLLADLRSINGSLEAQVNSYFYVDLINTIYKKIDPHPEFKRISFSCEFPEEGKPKLQVYIEDEKGENIISPTLNFSAAQVNVLSLSIFLAKALNTKNDGKTVDCIFIDDPVQSMDSINVLGVIDLFRSLSLQLGKQIIISTHDDSFHSLLKQKLPEHLFKSKFLELESFGKVAAHSRQ